MQFTLLRLAFTATAIMSEYFASRSPLSMGSHYAPSPHFHAHAPGADSRLMGAPPRDIIASATWPQDASAAISADARSRDGDEAAPPF